MTKEQARQVADKLFDQIEFEDVSLSVTFEDEYVEISVYDKKKNQ